MPKVIENEAMPEEVVIMESKEIVEKNCKVQSVTLLRYCNNINQTEVDYPSNEKIFSAKHEVQLVRYCQHAVRLNYGFSPKEFRKFSFEYAVANNINCPPKWHENKIAGTDWLNNFLGRNKKLPVYNMELSSFPTEPKSNQSSLETFYGYLAKLLDENNFEPENIYNIDQTEIGLSEKFKNFTSMKSSDQIIASNQNNKTVGMCLAVNAVGKTIPPLFTVSNKKSKDEPVGRSDGTKYGWLQEVEFLDFIKHFAKYAKAGPDNKVLLMLDNKNHLKLPVIEFCKMNFITMLSFPPNTPEKIQPLDRSVFGPFKTFYDKACNDWILNNPGKKINIYDIQNIARSTLPQAATPHNIIEGFSCSGIHPFNANIFKAEKILTKPVDTYLNNEDQIDITNFEPLDDDITNTYQHGNSINISNMQGLRRSNRVKSKRSRYVIEREFLEKYFKAKEKSRKKRKINMQCTSSKKSKN